MYSLLIIIHVIVCIVLTVVILLQSSKGGGLAGVFGGGGGIGAVFGGRGAASFLSRLTTVLAILFMLVSLILGLITGGGAGNSSIVSQERARGTMANPLPTVPTEGAIEQPPIPVPEATDNKPEASDKK